MSRAKYPVIHKGPGSRYTKLECTAPKTGKHRDEKTRQACPKCGGTNVDKANAFISRAPSLGDSGAARGVRTNGANAHIETRDANGKLHSFDDEPSVIVLRPDGSRKRAEWHKHGRKHRDGGRPAAESYASTERGEDFANKRYYFENGKKGRSSDGLGSEKLHRETHEVHEREWCNSRGKVVRAEGRIYYSNKFFRDSITLNDDDGHKRIDGPSTVVLDEDGTVFSETYFRSYGNMSTPKANAYAHFLVEQGVLEDDRDRDFIEHLTEMVHPGFVGEGKFRLPEDDEVFIADTMFGRLER